VKFSHSKEYHHCQNGILSFIHFFCPSYIKKRHGQRKRRSFGVKRSHRADKESYNNNRKIISDKINLYISSGKSGIDAR
jgi:hypothetical protein